MPTSTAQPTSSAKPTTTHQPTTTYFPTDFPTTSIKPSASPTTTYAPTTTVAPSVQPSLSAKPSATPTTSPKPSVSMQPSLVPSVSMKPSTSSQPTISEQPTTCLHQIYPPVWTIRGARDNPFPDGAFEYLAQNTNTATIRITQKWSLQPLSWIAPFYYDYQADLWRCTKFREVPYDNFIDTTFECRGAAPQFVVIVSDDTLLPGPNLTLPQGCQDDPFDIGNKMTLYAFEVKCTPPPQECLEVVL